MSDCAGFAPIQVAPSEIDFLFATPPPHGEVFDQMRITYREVAAHNRFGRERCGWKDAP